MARKRQANLERFAGSIADLVGDTKKKKNRAGQKIGKPKFQLDRKRKRKEEKEARKERKLKHILTRAGATLPEETPVEPSPPETKKRKKTKKEPFVAGRDSLKSLQSKQEKIYSAAADVYTRLTKEEADMANKKEDKAIKDLEKRLGIKKNQKTPKSFNEDGLGYVLDFEKTNNEDKEEGEDGEDSAADAAVDGLFEDLDSDNDSDGFFPSDEEEEEEENFGGEEEGEEEGDSGADMDQDENYEDVMSDEDLEGDEEDEDERDDEKDDKEENNDEECTNPAASGTAYVPPHLRNLDASSLLNRRIRGYVNRVSTSNIRQLLSDVELLYQDHPRGEVSSTILARVSESCLISTLMPARLCAEHMLLVACLSANIGAEFVSPLLEELAGLFRGELGKEERRGKVLNNAVSMICYLYSLKVVSCVLVFDLIRALLDSFTEADLEVLLYIFKSVGVDIRKDDPQALKDIVQVVNDKGAKMREKSSRFTWFVDTLTAVKNNNVNKIPNYDKSDIVDIQKAFKATVKANPPNLQVSLADLVDAPMKGRWWVVGAAWAGTDSEVPAARKAASQHFDSRLLALAKKNHMNTEVRRNVFCVLMSSEDYEHCFEQMVKLNLKDKEEREVIHVAVLCALKCKTYNPYYAGVIAKFCGFSKSYQVTTQFSLWDRLKDLGSLTQTKRENLTQLLSNLISTKTISLAVLKVVNFAEIQTDDVTFFKGLFTSLLSNSEGVVTEIFGRVQPLPLDSLKNGMKVFMKHFLKHDLSGSELKNMKIALKCF